MEIKLKSFSKSDYFDVAFLILIIGSFGVFLFFQGIRLILFEVFSYYYILSIIIGSLILYVIFISIKTISKVVTFFQDSFEVEFLKKKISFQYSEIDWIKFVHPPRSTQHLLVGLKKRKYGIKSFPINLNNKKEDLMILLNHARSQGVPTGLNEVGEQYFKFNKNLGKYEARQDKKIDISKLW